MIRVIVGLGVGLFLGLLFGPVGGAISGLVGGLTDTVKVGKASPNQGIKLSRKNALAVFLVTWLIFGLIGGLLGGLLVGLISGLISGLRFGLRAALFGGLLFGLIFGLNRGGSAVIKHYALRLTLWLNGYTPFKFIKFLDHCAKLILLKKVGGGYIFIHRMLPKVPPILWTGRAQISEKELQTCLQSIEPMTRTSARKRSIFCSAAGARSSGSLRNSVLLPIPYEPGGTGLSARGA